MSANHDWEPARYRAWLALKVRELRLDPRFLRRRDESDLVQMTLLRAHERQAQCQGTAEAQRMGWLLAILHNVVRDEQDDDHAQKRDVAREQAMDQALNDSAARSAVTLAAPDSSPSERAIRHEQEMRLAQALERLPGEQGDVLVLHYQHGLKIAEIAERLDKTAKAVSMLLYRGKQELGKLLSPE